MTDFFQNLEHQQISNLETCIVLLPSVPLHTKASRYGLINSVVSSNIVRQYVIWCNVMLCGLQNDKQYLSKNEFEFICLGRPQSSEKHWRMA